MTPQVSARGAGRADDDARPARRARADDRLRAISAQEDRIAAAAEAGEVVQGDVERASV